MHTCTLKRVKDGMTRGGREGHGWQGRKRLIDPFSDRWWVHTSFIPAEREKGEDPLVASLLLMYLV